MVSGVRCNARLIYPRRVKRRARAIASFTSVFAQLRAIFLQLCTYNSDERSFSIFPIKLSIASSFVPIKLHCKLRSRHSSSSSCIINALDVILRSSDKHAVSENCKHRSEYMNVTKYEQTMANCKR